MDTRKRFQENYIWLVIENHCTRQDFIQSFIGRVGDKSEVTDTVESAKYLVKKKCYNIILLNMEIFHGNELKNFSRSLRGDYIYTQPILPIIAFTSKNNIDKKAFGVDDVYPKPFTFDHIRRIKNDFLPKRHTFS